MPTKKTKNTVVDRKFLIDLANSIYDPKTRRFLRLCKGVLQNGPDPTNEARPMHCGLGELYFAMTGKQPEKTRIDEDGVVKEAIARSTFNIVAKANREKASIGIKKLHLHKELEKSLLYIIKNNEPFSKAEENFRDALGEIPNINDDDDGCRHGTCKVSVLRSRSARVAKKLRAAAALLPK